VDAVVGESAAVLQLLAREDEALLGRRDVCLVLDLGLDGVPDSVTTTASIGLRHLQGVV
jgi:hypothetical protein